jgi:hypothetical protein
MRYAVFFIHSGAHVLNMTDDISRCHRAPTAFSPVFMIYDAITSRNLLVGPDCFYHLYFLLEIYFLFKHGGSSLPLVRVREGCMSRCGQGHRKSQRLGLLTCGLKRERARERPTDSNLKGIYDRFSL